MAEFQSDRISELKDPGCWRLCRVQTSGCMATERRTDEQREQQQREQQRATVSLMAADDATADG